MTYEPKFWIPDEESFDEFVEKARGRVEDAMELAFELVKDTFLKLVDKSVCEAVEDHVKEGVLWVVYEEDGPYIEFIAFLGEGRKDEPEWPTRSEHLRALFQEALDNCDDEEHLASLWRALIKTYDDWKTREPPKSGYGSSTITTEQRSGPTVAETRDLEEKRAEWYGLALWPPPPPEGTRK